MAIVNPETSRLFGHRSAPESQTVSRVAGVDDGDCFMLTVLGHPLGWGVQRPVFSAVSLSRRATGEAFLRWVLAFSPAAGLPLADSLRPIIGVPYAGEDAGAYAEYVLRGMRFYPPAQFEEVVACVSGLLRKHCGWRVALLMPDHGGTGAEPSATGGRAG